jgi:hypothetical protein
VRGAGGFGGGVVWIGPSGEKGGSFGRGVQWVQAAEVRLAPWNGLSVLLCASIQSNASCCWMLQGAGGSASKLSAVL